MAECAACEEWPTDEMTTRDAWLLPGAVGVGVVSLAVVGLAWADPVRRALRGDTTQLSYLLADVILVVLLGALVLSLGAMVLAAVRK